VIGTPSGAADDATSSQATDGQLHAPERARRAKELTAAVLTVMRISEVINVDDSYRDDATADIEMVMGAVRSGSLTPDDLVAQAETRSLVLDADGELLDLQDIITKLETHAPNLSEAAVRELTDAAVRARDGDVPAGSADVTGDRLPEVDDDIETLLKLRELVEDAARFTKKTLRSWTAEQDALLSGSGPILVLFDQNYDREGGSPQGGEQLIARLLTRDLPHVSFGLLTHQVQSHDDELDLARQISERLDCPLGRLVVIAKNRLTAEPESLPEALRVALLTRETGALTEHLVQALAVANQAGIEAIQMLEPYTIVGILQSAQKEGAYEPEGVARVANTTRRRRLVRELHSDAFAMNTLSTLRTALAIPLNSLGLVRPANLSGLLRNERYDDADHLSSSNLPLETGDIFRFEDPAKIAAGQADPGASKQVVLLLQPCDAIIRPNGHRANATDTVVVAWMRPAPSAMDGKPQIKSTDVELHAFDVDANGRPWPWVVQLPRRDHIPTVALDACVLSADGAARITIGDPAPPALTPAWSKRHQALQAWAGKIIEKVERFDPVDQPLDPNVRGHLVASLTGTSTASRALRAQVDVVQKTVCFGLRRVGRLADPDARALLTEAAQHLSRPARDTILLVDPEDGGAGAPAM